MFYEPASADFFLMHPERFFCELETKGVEKFFLLFGTMDGGAVFG
jgi:hypothetical protein